MPPSVSRSLRLNHNRSGRQMGLSPLELAFLFDVDGSLWRLLMSWYGVTLPGIEHHRLRIQFHALPCASRCRKTRHYRRFLNMAESSADIFSALEARQMVRLIVRTALAILLSAAAWGRRRHLRLTLHPPILQPGCSLPRSR